MSFWEAAVAVCAVIYFGAAAVFGEWVSVSVRITEELKEQMRMAGIQ